MALFQQKGLFVSMYKGYTIIELVVVIAIIGILLTFSIPAFNSFLGPQEGKVVLMQLESDLRTLQNKAANGVAALRVIDSNGNGALDDAPQNVRVSWVARFQNNAREYTLASCQYNEGASIIHGTESENWNQCQQKETKRLQYNFFVSPCVGASFTSCTSGDYVIYFKPIYGNVEIYPVRFSLEESIDIRAPHPNFAVPPPIRLRLTSPSRLNTEYTLIINGDGTISQSCVSNGVQIKCE